jgi:hypothetical protein
MTALNGRGAHVVFFATGENEHVATCASLLPCIANHEWTSTFPPSDLLSRPFRFLRFRVRPFCAQQWALVLVVLWKGKWKLAIVVLRKGKWALKPVLLWKGCGG